MKGRVKWWSEEKGYGFIEYNDNENVFAHVESVDKNIYKRPIMPAGWHVLEVKFDEYLPDYIKSTLQLDSLKQTAFSKFYLCRKYNV